MPDNITSDNRETIFLDVDGVLVKHNYHPETQEEEFIDSVFKFLEDHKDSFIVLTTSRIPAHLGRVLGEFYRRLKRVPDRVIHSLPTGKRILINDYKNGQEYKSIAINLIRDKGFSDDR